MHGLEDGCDSAWRSVFGAFGWRLSGPSWVLPEGVDKKNASKLRNLSTNYESLLQYPVDALESGSIALAEMAVLPP